MLIIPAQQQQVCGQRDINFNTGGGVCEVANNYTKTGIALAEFVDCEDAAAKTRIFPYSPSLTSGWWSGLALSNPNDAPITVNLKIYEQDGDMYNAAITVPAKGLSVGLMDSATFINPVAAGGDAVFGDEAFWMIGESTLPFYGFYMMGSGTEAQGFLPFSPDKF